jgi:hypothetical protein
MPMASARVVICDEGARSLMIRVGVNGLGQQAEGAVVWLPVLPPGSRIIVCDVPYLIVRHALEITEDKTVQYIVVRKDGD